MYLENLLPGGLYHPLLPRETDTSCWGGIGQGECLGSSECKGLIYSNQCTDTPGGECCLHRRCAVPEGTGYCRDTHNQTCDGGNYFAGAPPNWPCPGISSIQCCVKHGNMSNGTSSSSLSLSSTLIPTSTSTASTTTSSSPKATITPAGGSGTDTGLSGSQIGGIVGGVVGGVLVFAVVGLVLFFRRRGGGESGAGGVSESAGDLDETVGLGKDVPMLGGSMRQEMDAQGGAVLHEMEGIDRVLGTGSGEKGMSELEGERTVVAELDGGDVVRRSGG